ncbi:MAG: hypothetical protein FJ398_23625 [Verrucomicrobia bacterium]|nr:hypothetical protein [Verrucomicrobiota bacterium]
MKSLRPLGFFDRPLGGIAAALIFALLGQVTSEAAKILFIINTVVDPVTTANAHDQEVRDRLVGQGHTVTLADDTTVTPGDGSVVSSSAFPLTIGREAMLIATNATVGVDENRVAIWAYDTGARLADNTTVVPSRRVAFFFNATTAPGSYSDVAYALFDAAVKWALESAPKSPPPTVTITSPAAGTTFPAGGPVTLAATASKTGGAITKVEFYQGTTKIGESTQSPYTFTWSNVPDGRYSLTAKAIDNANDSVSRAKSASSSEPRPPKCFSSSADFRVTPVKPPLWLACARQD